MRSSTIKLYGAALAVVLLSGTGARAGLVHWSYSWSNSPSEVLSNAPGTSSITLTNETVQPVVANSDIVSTNLRTVSIASPSSPDTFTNRPYVLTLTITDQASNQSGSVQFSGSFSGTLSSGNANISNTFNQPTVQTLILGGDKFTITLPYYTPPGPPNSTNAGSISAHVTVELVQNLPEPSSLLLAGLGVVLLGLVRSAARLWRARLLVGRPS